jgi:hypothetical protein
LCSFLLCGQPPCHSTRQVVQPAVADVKGNVAIECKGVERNEVNELIKIFSEGLRNFQEFQKQMLERQPDISIRCNPVNKVILRRFYVLSPTTGEAKLVIFSYRSQIYSQSIPLFKLPQNLDSNRRSPARPQTRKIVPFLLNF